MTFWEAKTHAVLPPHAATTARTHFVAFLLAMGLGTLVEPASAQLSSGAKTQAAPAIAPQAYSRSFLLYHHHTWKAGETIRGTMPLSCPCHRRRSDDPERLFESFICSSGLQLDDG